MRTKSKITDDYNENHCCGHNWRNITAILPDSRYGEGVLVKYGQGASAGSFVYKIDAENDAKFIIYRDEIMDEMIEFMAHGGPIA